MHILQHFQYDRWLWLKMTVLCLVLRPVLLGRTQKAQSAVLLGSLCVLRMCKLGFFVHRQDLRFAYWIKKEPGAAFEDEFLGKSLKEVALVVPHYSRPQNIIFKKSYNFGSSDLFGFPFYLKLEKYFKYACIVNWILLKIFAKPSIKLTCRPRLT